MMPARSLFRLAVAAFLPVFAGAQVPPQAVPVLKKIGTDLLKKALTPSMQVEQFTLGGIKATEVDCDSGATPEAFSGTATFALPAPLGPRKLPFKGLVLKGAVAEGALDEPLKDFTATHQGWTYHLTRVVLSTQGSRVEGTATLAGLKLDVGPLALTPQGLQGTLTPGDLPLAEGPFSADLREGEAAFGPSGVKLKGRLEVRIAPPVRHGTTGADLVLDGGPTTFDSALLAGTGVVAPNLASDLPLHHRGLTWIVTQTAFRFERGTPILGGPTRLRFPLDTFCRADATDQAYLSDPFPCHMRGQAPEPTLPKPSGLRAVGAIRASSSPTVALVRAWEGFSGSFPLPAATLHPSGLTTYRFEVQKGTVRVEKGRIDPAASRITGRVAWGPGFAVQTTFTEAVADFSEGLYVKGSAISQPAEAGAYRIHTMFGTTLCDFSSAYSPEGLPAAWKGVFLPSFQVALPGELYTLSTSDQRFPVLAPGQAGRFEGNGTFSGALGVKIPKRVLLYFAPIQLEAFELQFQEGALISGPLVKGTLHLVAEPLLTEEFQPPISFRLTQNGVEQVEVHTRTEAGPMVWDTDLIGIRIALESARLHPTLLDMTGQFDFAIQGADIPSVTFDHLTLEASGGPLEGASGSILLTIKGSRWSALPDRPSVRLWGFPFTLSESGYGTLDDPASGPPRFYVGLGGDIEANPILPTLTNRLLFTTENKKATVVLESPYGVDEAIPALGSLKGALGFHVETADQTVSDAYFEGDAKLKLNLGDGLDIDGGMRFGQATQGGTSFPYFYALGHLKSQGAGITVAPYLEVYGLLGGLAQNFLPDDIRNTEEITGKTDPALGLAVMAGVDAGTLDRFTLDAYLDLYLSQNLTTVLQGRGWLFANRGKQPPDRQVSADIRFTRNPDTFHATLDADLNLFEGVMRPMGRVELHFGPDSQYLHLGTQAAPITVRFLNAWEGWGYMTVDWQGGQRSFGAGGGVSYRKSGNFGIVYGEAWLTAGGDLLIEVDSDGDPRFLGTVAAEGGARFGMRFKTYKTHKITIFSGSLGTNLAFQAPDRPTFSGTVTLRYRVLGGLFKGSVSAHLDL